MSSGPHRLDSGDPGYASNAWQAAPNVVSGDDFIRSWSLLGGKSHKTFIWNRGDGDDTVDFYFFGQKSGQRRGILRLGLGIAPGEVSLERRLMAELGAGTDLGEENPERDPLYRLGEADAKGYYDGKGEALQELREMRRIWPIRAYYLSWYSLDSTLTLTEHDKRMANSSKEIIRLVADYWEIPEGASGDVWPQYVWEKERKMRSMEGEALSSPTHLLFLVETGTLLRSFAPEEAYRCMSLAWVRQCQAHRELSARIVEILRRSGLREDYARAVRKWGGRGLLHTPFPATRLGVFIKPGEVFEELFNETYKFRSQIDF